jgi:hypothetical protein
LASLSDASRVLWDPFPADRRQEIDPAIEVDPMGPAAVQGERFGLELDDAAAHDDAFVDRRAYPFVVNPI